MHLKSQTLDLKRAFNSKLLNLPSNLNSNKESYKKLNKPSLSPVSNLSKKSILGNPKKFKRLTFQDTSHLRQISIKKQSPFRLKEKHIEKIPSDFENIVTFALGIKKYDRNTLNKTINHIKNPSSYLEFANAKDNFKYESGKCKNNDSNFQKHSITKININKIQELKSNYDLFLKDIKWNKIANRKVYSEMKELS